MKYSIFICCLAIFSVVTISCNKLRDYLPGNGHGSQYYRIKTFTPAIVSEQPFTFTIFYNSYGDPDSAVAIGRRVIRFEYDQQHRLIEHSFEFYAPAPDEFSYSLETTGTHWYWYEGNRIVKDSVWVDYYYRSAHDSLHDWYEKISDLTYDELGRISKDTFLEKSTHQGGTHFNWSAFYYTYDRNGNLIDSNWNNNGPDAFRVPVVYDDKVNYLRTHPVWQFLTRNYSRNNEVGAIGYNEAGLPLGFSRGSTLGVRQVLFGSILYTQGDRFIEITYDRAR